MSDHADQIRMMALSLPVGETMQNQICPKCGGGEQKKPSLAITRFPDKLAYICYRNSCDFRGYVDDNGVADFSPKAMGRASKKQYKVRPYRGELTEPTMDDLDFFYGRFGLEDHITSRFIRRNHNGEYLLRITDRFGSTNGWVVRQPVWKGKPTAPVISQRGSEYPKALTRMHVEAEPISMAIVDGSPLKPMVLVEDQVSQWKAYQCGYNATALLGTGMNISISREISKINPSRVIVALDNDALATAFRIAHDYGLVWNSVRVAPLPADLKDLTDDEVCEILG